MPLGKTWLLYQMITNIFVILAVLKYSRYYVNTITKCNVIFSNEKIFNPLSILRTAYLQWMKVSYNSETFTQVYRLSLKLLTGTKNLLIKSSQALTKSVRTFR